MVDHLTQVETFDEASSSARAWLFFSRIRLLYFMLNNAGAKFIEITAPLLVEVPPMLLTVLTRTTAAMASVASQIGAKGATSVVPVWLSTALLLIDLFERLRQVAEARKSVARVLSIPGHDYVWKFSDSRGFGRDDTWIPFSAENNEIVNAAYVSGENELNIEAAGSTYSVNFATMTQSNLATYNRRRIMRDAIKRKTDEHEPVALESMHVDTLSVQLSSFTHPETKLVLLETCVQLLRAHIDQEALDSVMRFESSSNKELHCSCTGFLFCFVFDSRYQAFMYEPSFTNFFSENSI